MRQRIASSVLLLICFTSLVGAIDNKLSGCSSKQEQIDIFVTLGETKKWSLYDQIFEGQDLTYQLTDDKFKLQQQIYNSGGSHAHSSNAQIIQSVKPLRKTDIFTVPWLNSFVMLEQDFTSVHLYFADDIVENSIDAPNFNKKVTIATEDNQWCYDVEYIDTDKLVVDCQQSKNNSKGKTVIYDQIYLYSKAQGKVVAIQEQESLTSMYDSRILTTQYTISATGTRTNYLFRAIKATYNDLNQLTGNSYVEVFIIGDDLVTSTGSVLDRVTLGLLVGKADLEFNIVELDIKFNQIIVLDAQHGVIGLEYKPSGSWEFLYFVDPKIGLYYSIDVHYEHRNNGKELGVLAILGYDFFVVVDIEKTYVVELPYFQTTYKSAKIRFSQDNIVIKGENNYLLFYKYDPLQDKYYLNKKFTTTADAFLVNPYSPDLVLIDQEKAYRYTISSGYIEYIGSTATKQQATILLKAIAPNKEECLSYITYKILENTDSLIYQLFSKPKPFPNTLTEGENKVILQQLASGPNLSYQQPDLLQENLIDISVKTRQTLDFTQWPTNVVFAQILEKDIDNSEQFFQILQTQDNNLQIWFCQHNSVFDNKIDCSKVTNQQINIGYKITKQNFQAWVKDALVNFAYLDTAYSISLNLVSANGVEEFRKIQLDKTDQNNEIQSILHCEDYFLVRIADNNILGYYTYYEIIHHLKTNGETLAEFGYTGQWSPKAWFVNKRLHPNIVFILHNDHITILNIQFAFITYLTSIKTIANIEYSITIAQNTFFVIKGKSSTTTFDASIDEYNFDRLNNIYKTKSIQLLWYDIQSPLAVTQSDITGITALRGLCIKCDKTFSLIFKPDTVQHDVIYQAWPIAQTNIADGTEILFAAGGADQLYLYTNVQGTQTLTSVLTSPVMTIKSTFDQTSYAQKQDIILQVTNYSFQDVEHNVLSIKQNVQTISYQTTIILSEDKFPLINGLTLDSTDVEHVSELGNEWYSGQIGNINLECGQCETHIKIQNIVEIQNPKLFNGYEIRDQIEFDDNYHILQATKGLLFLNKDDTLAAIYDFDLPSTEYKCFQATVSADKMVIYSLCHDGEQYTVYATGCFSISGCSPLGEKFKLGQAAKIQIIENDALVVLHTDNISTSDYEGSSIVIYGIEFGLAQWTLNVLDVIDLISINNRLGSQWSDFTPSDFYVAKQYSPYFTQTIYKLFITDSQSGLVFLDFFLTSQNKYTFIAIENLNLHEYLNNEVGQYTFSTTKFLSFKFLFKPDYDWSSNMLRTYFVILTNDAPQYVLKLYFTKTETQNTALTLKGLTNVVNRYGSWQAINKLTYQNQVLAVPYINGNNVVIVLYDLPFEIALGVPTPSTSIGTYKFVIGDGEIVNPLNFGLFFSFQTQTTLLYLNQFIGALKSFIINDQSIITFSNQNGDLTDQKITITVENDFSSESLTFQLNIQAGELDGCQTLITNTKVYPSTGEILQWNLGQNLFQGTSLKYQLDKETDFSVTQSLALASASTELTATQIIAFKPLLTKNRIWSNNFSFLNYDKTSSKYTVQYNKNGKSSLTPTFDQSIALNADNANCIDLAQLEATTFVVDCQEQTKTYLVLLKETQQTSTTPQQTDLNHRQLGHYYSDNTHFVVRASLAITDDGSLGTTSFVELYKVNGNALQLVSTLDKTKLQELAAKEIKALRIVDIKIGSSGAIYLLDATNGIYVVSYQTAWKLSKTITFKFGQAYAFDRVSINSTSEIFAILGYNYFLVIDQNGNPKKVQDLTFTITDYPQKIRLSQQYVFVEEQNQVLIYHFDDNSSSIIDVVTTRDGAYLVNPFRQDLITVSLTQSSRYTFSLGILKFKGSNQATTKLTDLTISATAQNGDVCKSIVQYQIISSQSQSIIKKKDTDAPLPTNSNDNSLITLGDLVSGPNLVYALAQPKTGFLQEKFTEAVFQSLRQNGELDFKNQPVSPIFQSSLLTDDQILYQVYQTANKKLELYKCNLDEFTQYVCNDSGSITLQTELNDQLFSIYIGDDQLINIITIDSNYEIKFYYVKDNKLNVKKTITFDKQDGNEIISLLNQGTYLFILQKNGNISNILINDDSTNIINQVNGDNLNGFDADWNPIQLYGNRILRQNVIFIINNNNVAIVNYLNDFECVEIIGFDEENEVKIANSQKTFFLLKDQELLEYNYENLNSIYQSKTVELFGYQIILPLIAQQELNSGIFVIRVNKNEQTYLNYYKPSQLQHDTFFTSIQIGTKFTNEFLLSVAGNEYMLLSFVNQEKLQTLKYALLNPELSLVANQNEGKYLTEWLVALTISNEGTEKVNYEQTVKVINTQTHLYFTKNDYLLTIELDYNTTHKAIEIDNDWINGQLFQSTLNQVKDNIILKSYLYQVADKQLKTNHFTYATTLLTKPLLLSTHSFFTVNNAETYETNKEVSFSDTLSCFRANAFEKSVYVLCNNGVEDQVALATCDDKLACTPETTYISQKQASYILPLGQDLNAILHSDADNPEYQDGYITIQRFSKLNEIWISTIILTIDYDFIKQKLGTQAPTSFKPSGIQYSDNESDNTNYQFQLIISDSVNGLLFVDFSVSKTTYVATYLNLKYQYLTTWLNDNGQYASDDTLYYQNLILSSKIANDKKTISLIIVTSNASQYLLTLEFTRQANKSNTLSKISVDKALNRYGSWQALNYITGNQDHVFLAYYNGQNVLIGTYFLEKDTQVAVIHGAYQFVVPDGEKVTSLNLLAYYHTYLIVGDSGKGLTRYSVNSKETIELNQSENNQLTNQTLTLTFKNQNSALVHEINLSIKPDDNDDVNDDGSIAWIIILSVAGGLLMLGLLGFVFFKKKRTEEQGSENDEGYSPMN